MTKLIKVEGKKIDLNKLYNTIKNYLIDDNFRIVKDDVTENAYHLRALKTKITRIIIGATRDVEVVIAGDPDNFAVIVLVGAWGKNLAVSATTGFIVASTVAVSALAVGTVAAAGSYLTAKRFEEQLLEQIEEKIDEHSKLVNE